MRALLVLCMAACVDAPVDTYRWSLPEGMPVPRVPGDNPMTHEKVELGRHLFYDTRLSADGTQSCSSCHIQSRAFTDGRVVPIGITGQAGRHNAMSLANVAYNSSSTWAAHIPRLEDQALLPMFGEAPVELGLAGREAEVLARLEVDYGRLTVGDITHALASFQRTLLSGDSPFDRFVRGDGTAMTPSAQRGLALFESDRLGCTRCHGGFNLASSYDHEGMAPQVQFFNTGLYNVDGKGAYPAHDRGLVEATGDPSHMGRFRAPTLRNIALTAPYLHDGSAATLTDVLAIYEAGGRGAGITSPLKSVFMTGFSLSDAERTDLLAFLDALTDKSFVENPAFASPW